MSAVLDLRVKRPRIEVPASDWGWKSEAAVFAYMIARSGLQEKTVAIEVGIDNSTLAKVKQGTARPSEEQIARLMDCTGSDAWQTYWLLKCNKDPRSLRILESEHERENRELRERVAALEAEREIERNYAREVVFAAK